MVELIVLGAFALSLFVCVGLGVSILYALILGFVLFCGYAVYRGHSLLFSFYLYLIPLCCLARSFFTRHRERCAAGS